MQQNRQLCNTKFSASIDHYGIWHSINMLVHSTLTRMTQDSLSHFDSCMALKNHLLRISSVLWTIDWLSRTVFQASSSSNPQAVLDFGKGRTDYMSSQSRPILLAPLVSSALRKMWSIKITRWYGLGIVMKRIKYVLLRSKTSIIILIFDIADSCWKCWSRRQLTIS